MKIAFTLQKFLTSVTFTWLRIRNVEYYHLIEYRLNNSIVSKDYVNRSTKFCSLSSLVVELAAQPYVQVLPSHIYKAHTLDTC